LIAVSAKGDQPSEIAECVIVIGDAPPGPGPGPVPIPPGPTPVPQPDSAPIAAEGFRVLILHETEPPTVLPESELAVLTSPEVMSFLKSKTAREGNGAPSFRVWDDDYSDADLANSPTYFRDAYRKAVNQKKPDERWVIVSNGTKKTGESGPLPKTAASFIEMMKKYADN
jgi:hypothetical protein